MIDFILSKRIGRIGLVLGSLLALIVGNIIFAPMLARADSDIYGPPSIGLWIFSVFTISFFVMVGLFLSYLILYGVAIGAKRLWEWMWYGE